MTNSNSLDLSALEKAIPVLQDAVVEKPKESRRVYKSGMKSMQMITPKGHKILFVNGRYITDNADVIEYLDKEIAAGHPDVRIDSNEMYYDPQVHDPVAALRKKFRDELLAEMAAVAGNPTRDMGQSVQGNLSPASTTSIQAVTSK
jgi:hypothetical protein